jgi:hypothetical protein
VVQGQQQRVPCGLDGGRETDEGNGQLPKDARQRIEFVNRDRSGITAIVTSTAVVDAQTVIDAIQSGRGSFEAGSSSWDRAEVAVRHAFGVAYLFANWDGTRRNNLHELAAQ